MPRVRRGPLRRYAIAILASLAATGLTALLWQVLWPSPFLLFLGAVLLTSSWSGFRPALLATALCATAGLAITMKPHPPPSLPTFHVVAECAVFILMGVLTAGLNAALRRANETARAVIDASPLPILRLDPTGTVTGWNRAAERIFGWSESEAIGRLNPIVGESQQEEFLARLQRALRGEVLTGQEVCRQRRDGTLMDLSVSTAPIYDSTGLATGVMSVIADITERKRAEEVLRLARRQAEEAYQRERRIAIRFQSSLLPRGPISFSGCELAHTYRPAWNEADVGGDFYNLFPIDERHVGLVVGDVAGKGLEAAVVAARVQQSVVTLAVQERRPPGAVLDAIHPVVSLFEDVDVLVTLFFAILDSDTGELQYATAGHEPVLLWRAAEERVSELQSEGMAICALTAPDHVTRRVSLAPDDVLLLFTDGLPEARAGHGAALLGQERIRRVLYRHHAAPAEAIIEALYREAMEHSRGNLRDDVALVVLRRANTRLSSRAIWVDPPEMSGLSWIATPGEPASPAEEYVAPGRAL